MPRQVSDYPTRVETEILQVLWVRGEATLREVCDDLARRRRVTTSGIATIMKIMVDKGYARVTDERRPQKFTATTSKAETGGSVVGDVLNRFFGGSMFDLVRAALGNDKAKLSETELAEIQQMLADHAPSKAATKPAKSAK